MLIKPKVVIGAKSKDGTGPLYPGCVYDVDDETAMRLVAKGVAVTDEIRIVPAPAAANLSENPPKDENAQNEPSTPENGEGAIKGNLVKEDLEEMSYTQLKELAKDMGIETGKIKSKEAMIEAICSVEVTADADDVVETGEEPPTFDAQEVVE